MACLVFTDERVLLACRMFSSSQYNMCEFDELGKMQYIFAFAHHFPVSVNTMGDISVLEFISSSS